jgi:phosphatidylserine/phosphatidylglycerophosphate/cardiolipin synthase-like enzyme
MTYGGDEDRLIARKIKAKVDATADAAQSGDYIRVAMYKWGTDGGGTAVANSLVRAVQRGVSVRVVIGPGNVDIKDRLRAAGVGVTVCAKACMPDAQRGAMHNKFVLIRKGDTRLVLQSSSNLNRGQARHAQNLLISRDDRELFSHYVNYWRRLNARSWSWNGEVWSDPDKARYGSNDLSRVYFYPRDSGDPLVGVLGNVTECRPGDDRVWVAASRFREGERPEVARQLERLRGLGCDVRILVQKSPDRAWLQEMFGTSIVRCNQWNHNKFVVIDARYAGQWRKAVFTGSYNLTVNSRDRANDTMLRIINGWVTNRYIDAFREINTNRHGCDP